MNTTYDDIFECFIENTGVDTTQLPTEQEKIYGMIHNGIIHYNTKLDDGDINYDDISESIDTELDDKRILMLAYCIKYVYLENELVGFQELWTPFQKEIGIKNYKAQVTGREKTLERTDQKIIELITKIEDQSIM